MSNDKLRIAAEMLQGIREAINAYNKVASENHLYVIGIGIDSAASELSIAESFIPENIREEAYKARKHRGGI